MIATLLLVAGAVSVIAGGFAASVAAWRLIPRPAPTAGEQEAHQRIDDLERAMVDFAERHETLLRSSRATIGKLRRKVRKLEDDEGDDDDEVDAAEDPGAHNVVGLPDRPLTKADLYRRAGL